MGRFNPKKPNDAALEGLDDDDMWTTIWLGELLEIISMLQLQRI
jgi:hypothetical protein